MTTDIINPYSVETLFHSDTMFEMLKTHYTQKKHRRDAYIKKHLAQVVQKQKDKAWTHVCNEDLLLYGRYTDLRRQIVDEDAKIPLNTKRKEDLLILRDEAEREWQAHRSKMPGSASVHAA